ncbi:MAG: insulinase family protein [Acidobacteria bacterium]|nr:insulinase family protein [Acidobacteriota bacterium]
MGKFQSKKIFSLLLLFLLFTGVATAQEVDIKKLDQAIPMDYRVKEGILPNGIKYYIQKNAKPEKRAELRLVVNAGSLQEDEDQLGLAHFVEHMCFNGTKNFKKNELINYLQSVGVKFGAHLNAYTSFDETVYMITIPTDKQDIVDKGFQILEDWSHNVTFEDEEIEKERGVVIEEWRTGLGAQERIRNKTFPVIFKDSRYAKRLPIGTIEVLRSFKPETVRKFYRDWYRPELMSVVVVGDIDEAAIEAKIKHHFSQVPVVKDPRPRLEAEIPDHKETLAVAATDKEAAFLIAQVIYKQPAERVKTIADFRRSTLYQLFGGMFGRRFNEIAQQANPPYNFAGGSFNPFLRTKNAYSLFAFGGDDAEKMLKVLLTESKRVLEHGFTPGELESYKKEFLTGYENQFKEREKTDSGQIVYKYVDGFLTGEPSPSIEWQYDAVKKLLPTITVDEINPLIKKWVKDGNMVVIVTGPEKENTKTLADNNVKELVKQIDTFKTEAYVYKEIVTPLMAKIPTPGKIAKESAIEQFGIKELTLSNGVKVIIKPTDFKNDEIQMSAFSFGGTSLVSSDEDAISARSASQIINSSGIGEFSDTDVQKILSGKNVYAFPYIGETSEGLRGGSSPQDFETMLQLVNLYFVQPRKDEQAFQSYLAKTKAFLPNLLLSPEFYYSNEVSKILTQDHPRSGAVIRPGDIDKVNLDKAFQIYRERFADASDFQFFFVGNIDIEKTKPLFETYLGSLPVKGQTETFKDLGIRPPKGVVEKEVKKGKEPKSQVTIAFTGEVADEKDESLIRAVSEGLTIKLIENLREEKGGVYGTSANAFISKYPYSSYQVSIRFTCAPENVQKLINAAYDEIKKVQENGPTPEDLNKVKEARRRDLEKNQKENSYWLGLLERVYTQKKDINELTEANLRKKIDELSIEQLKGIAQKYLKFDNRVVVTLNPENLEK